MLSTTTIDGVPVSGADITLTTSSSAESTTSVFVEQLATTTSVVPETVTTLLPAIPSSVEVETAANVEPIICHTTASTTTTPSTATAVVTANIVPVEKIEQTPTPVSVSAPTIPTPLPAQVQVLSAPSIQLATIPVSTVVTNRTTIGDVSGKF